MVQILQAHPSILLERAQLRLDDFICARNDLTKVRGLIEDIARDGGYRATDGPAVFPPALTVIIGSMYNEIGQLERGITSLEDLLRHYEERPEMFRIDGEGYKERNYISAMFPKSAEGIEKFIPRGIGNNWFSCFICGYEVPDGGCQSDLAAFVPDEETGRRIVAMFVDNGRCAHLDTRRADEGRVQVKVGACDEHLPNLRLLNWSTARDNKISLQKITDCVPEGDA